jgi:hypothetical protein
LTERYFGPQPLSLGDPPPAAMLAAAEDALLQDLTKREHTAALSDLLAARSVTAFIGAIVRRMRPDAHVVEEAGAGDSTWRFWPRWVWQRLRRLTIRLAAGVPLPTRGRPPF